MASNDDVLVDLTYALKIDLCVCVEPFRMEEYPFEEWTVTASLAPEGLEIAPEVFASTGLPLTLGHGRRTLVSLYCGESLVLALDARDSDSLDLASYLFDGDQLKPELEDLGDGFGGTVLLMDHFALDPAWRGLGLGPLISLATMRTLALGRDVVCAALHAAPPGEWDDDTTQEERRRIANKIRKAWERAGFEVLKRSPEGWIMIAAGVGSSTWPDELWPRLLGDVNVAVSKRVKERIATKATS